MVSRNIYKRNSGFTLIEIIVVLAILTIMIAFSMNIDLNAFHGDTFFAEQSKIVTALERARSHAMANMFESVYGVCYDSGNYIIFRARTNCLPVASTDENIPADTNIISNSGTTSPFPTVVFDRLTGKLTPQLSPTLNEIDITISDGMKSAHIKINNEGAINW